MQPRSTVPSPIFARRSRAQAIPSNSAPFAGLVSGRIGNQAIRRAHLRPLVLLDFWHLLSLDAPSVAVAWLIFISSCTGLHADSYTAAALFLAVWIVYAADRLLDAGALPRFKTPAEVPPGLELRHHFHRRHRVAFCSVLALLLPVLFWLLPRLPRRTLIPEAALGLLLAVWLLRVHNPVPSADSRRLPKEFAVGLFFALAIYLPEAFSSPAPLAKASSLLPGALLFAGLCTLNCLFLYAWEHPDDLSRAHPATAFAVRHLVSFSCCGLAAALGMWAPGRSTPLGLLPLAACLSTLFLLTLHASRRRLSPLRLRALADVALLTPVPLLLLRRFPWHGFPARL